MSRVPSSFLLSRPQVRSRRWHQKAKRGNVVVNDVTTTHEALDVAYNGFCEGNVEIVRVVGHAAVPVTVPECVYIVIEDIVEAAAFASL